MNHISKEEILKLAEISKIILTEDEIESLLSELSQVLLYAERVTEYPGDAPATVINKHNITRVDHPVKGLGTNLLPKDSSDEDCFVVPLILE